LLRKQVKFGGSMDPTVGKKISDFIDSKALSIKIEKEQRSGENPDIVNNDLSSKLLAGVYLVEKYPTLHENHRNTFYFVRWLIVKCNTMNEGDVARAKNHVSNYKEGKLKDAIGRGTDDKIINLFTKFSSILPSDDLEEALFIDQKYSAEIHYFRDFAHQYTCIKTKSDDLDAFLPQNSILRNGFSNIDNIDKENYEINKSDLENLAYIARELDGLSDQQRNILYFFIHECPNPASYQDLFNKVVKNDLFKILDIDDFKGISHNITEEDLKLLEDRAKVKLWAQSLDKLKQINPDFVRQVEATMKDKVNDGDVANSKEAKVLADLMNLIDDETNQKLPQNLRIDAATTISRLNTNYKSSVIDVMRGNLFGFLEAEITSMRIGQYNKLSEAITHDNPNFKADFKNYYLVQDASVNKEFAQGSIPIHQHPFLAANDTKKEQMVLMAKAKTSEAMGPDQFNRIYNKISRTSDPEDVYQQVSGLIDLSLRLRESKSLEMKNAIYYGTQSTQNYNAIVDNVLLELLPIIKDNIEAWKEPLAALISKTADVELGHLKFGPQILSQAAIHMAFILGITENDPVEFKKSLSNPTVAQRFLVECQQEAKKKIYQETLRTEWENTYYNKLGNAPALDVFTSEFSKDFFVGPVDTNIVKVLQTAAQQGVQHSASMGLDPSILAKGYLTYFRHTNNLSAAPELHKVLPYCDLPALDNWTVLLESELSKKQVAQEDITKFLVILSKDASLQPRSIQELKVIINSYKTGLDSLQSKGFSMSDTAKDAVRDACVSYIQQERKDYHSLTVPTMDRLVALYSHNLPALEGWQDRKGLDSDLGRALVDEMNIRGVRGAVSESEAVAIESFLGNAKEWLNLGYSRKEAAVAICRYIEAQRNAKAPIDKNENLKPYLFEAVIESCLPKHGKVKAEKVITLLKSIDGRDTQYLTLEGKQKLQILAGQVAAANFANRRSLTNFNVLAKFSNLLSEIGLLSVDDLNNSTFDTDLFKEYFYQQQAYAFRNVNVREIMDAVAQDPVATVSRMLTPMISVLVGDKDNVTADKSSKLIEQLTQGEGKEAVKVLLQSLAQRFTEAGAVEFDIEMSTQKLFGSILSGVNKMREAEKVYLKDQVNIPVDNQEIPTLRMMLHNGVHEFSTAQMERSQGISESSLVPILDQLSKIEIPGWVFGGVKAAGKILGTSLISKLIKSIVSKEIKAALDKQLNLVSRQIDVLDTYSFDDSREVFATIAKLENSKKAEDKQKALLLDKFLRIPAPEREKLLVELKYRQELLQNVRKAMPQIVGFIMDAALNVLNNVDLSKHKKLIQYVKDIADHPEKPVDEILLLNMVYDSIDSVLVDSQKIYPNLFESITTALRAAPAVEGKAKEGVDENAVISPVRAKALTDQEKAKRAESQKALDKLIASKFEAGFFDSAQVIANKKSMAERFTTYFNDFGKTLTSNELQEISNLIDIGSSMIDPKSGYTDDLIAAACRDYCDTQIRSGNSIKAPVKKSQLYPFAFDAQVRQLTNQLIFEGNTRKLPGDVTEDLINKKVMLYLSHQKVGGTEEPLTANGRAVLREIISTMLDSSFSSGRTLLDPALLSRFGNMLKTIEVDDVTLMNVADPKKINVMLKAEAEASLGKWNPVTVVNAFTKDPAGCVNTMVGSVLNTIMDGSPIEKQNAKKTVAKLAEVCANSSVASLVKQFIEKQMGPFSKIDGLEIEVNISTQQIINGLKKNTQKLEEDLKVGQVTSPDKAAEYGVLAPALVRFVDGIAGAQNLRNQGKLKNEMEKSEIARVELLEKMGGIPRFALSMLLSATGHVKGILDFARPMIEVGLKSYLEGKITNFQKSVTELEKEVSELEKEFAGVDEEELSIADKEKLLKLKEQLGVAVDTLNLFKSLYVNRSQLIDLGSNVLVALLKRHKLSEHEGLIYYIHDLAQDPKKPVDKNVLMGLVLQSVNTLLNEADVYDDLVPGLLAGLTSIQKFAPVQEMDIQKIAT
jgi:hemerythrin-like domain-containing protein